MLAYGGYNKFYSTNKIKTLQPTKSEYESDGKWLFIGDSYCTHGGEPDLPSVIAKEIGIKKKNIIRKCVGGTGLTLQKGDTDKRFYALVDDMEKDESVSNILIIGGIMNDTKGEGESVSKEMKKLADFLKSTFPKATIFYAIPNWYKTEKESSSNYKFAYEWQNKILRRLPLYQSACEENGIVFLYNVTECLHGKKNAKYFTADGHHPSEAGKKKIAQAVAKNFI